MLDSELKVNQFLMQYCRLLVEDIADERMAEQPLPGVNHLAWVLGHLAFSADRASGLLGAEKELPPPDPGADLAAAGGARAGPGHLWSFGGREVGQVRPDLLAGGGEEGRLIEKAVPAWEEDHVRLETDKPFEEVAKAFERQLGRFDPEVYKSLAAGGDAEGVRAKIEAMAGPSGFMLFGTHNHGALLRLADQKRKAVQYVVGNPLFAVQMTQHDIRASLYAPLRVLLYENEDGKTCLEYDRPSSLFDQFNVDRIAPVAGMLDRKLEELVTEAVK